MNSLKKYLGVVWLLLGPTVIYFLFSSAAEYIDTAGKKDIHNPVIWIIIIVIFTPIAAGLMLFGWYAITSQYKKLPEDSQEV